MALAPIYLNHPQPAHTPCRDSGIEERGQPPPNKANRIPDGSRTEMMKRKPGGFTLVELLIALSIFALLTTIAYSGLNQILHAGGRTAEADSQLRGLQMAMVTLQRDFSQLTPRPIQDGLGGRLPALQLTTAFNSNIELTRSGWHNPLQEKRSLLQRVFYFQRDDQLIRTHWNQLDRTSTTKLIESPILKGIQQFRVRVLDQQHQWYEEWPPASEGLDSSLLPTAIEIELDSREFGTIRRLFAGYPQ